MPEINMDVHACPDKAGIEEADPDLLREMVATFVHTLMSAEVDPPQADWLRGAEPGAFQQAELLLAPRLRHPGRHASGCDS